MSLCKPNGLHVVTINIIYPWRQSVNFPSFPTDTELFEVLGEYSKDWCLHRMKTNVLSFSVPTGPLAGEYERPEDLRVSHLIPTFHGHSTRG
jgi:hypothetical protein